MIRPVDPAAAPLDARAEPFLRSVAEQVLRHRVGPTDEEALRDAIVAVLRAPRVEGAAERLLDDPPLLAAFFQNIDLLYTHESPQADHASAIVMQALARLDADG